MINIFIISLVWTFLSESSTSKLKQVWENLTFYQKWFILNIIKIIFLILVLLSIWKWEFDFNVISITLLILYSLLWILFTYFAINAINKADRSTNSLFSVIILPILLFWDIMIWYDINMYHIIWVIFIVSVLILSSYKWSISTKWLSYVIWAQIVASMWITIYKFMITNYSSVEAISIIDSFLMLSIFFFIIIYNIWFNWVKDCLKINSLKIWFLSAIWQTLWLFAYLFWPASIVTAIKRMLQMFWWVMFWHFVFKEENFWKKIWNLAVLSIWIIIMNFQAINVNANFILNINLSLFKWDISWYKTHIEQTIDIDNFSNNIKHSNLPYYFN